jgi:hypothetical protein
MKRQGYGVSVVTYELIEKKKKTEDPKKTWSSK